MRSKIILLLSLVLGVITTGMFFKYMQQFDSKKTEAAPMAEVIVAKDTINKNEKITEEKLEKVQVPKNSVLAKSIESFSEAEGKLAESMIQKGEPILPHRLISQKEEKIYVSRKVKEGYRAVAVSVNLPQSVSNLIEAEDVVDIIFSKENKEVKVDKPKVNSKFLLNNVRVLAVGRKMVLPEDTIADKDAKDTNTQYEEYTTVTLELKPKDAFTLVHASEEGNLHFILHPRPVMDENGTPKETGDES